MPPAPAKKQNAKSDSIAQNMLSKMSIETLKLCYAIPMVADSLNEELEKHAPPEAPTKPTEEQFNSPSRIQKEDSHGTYEQAANDKTENFRILAEYIKAHNGFCNLFDYKRWLHNNDPNIIDRKR